MTGMVLIALAAAVAATVAACGGESNGGGSTPEEIRITPQAPTGTTVDAKVGDTIVISLDANATTGFEWSFTAGDTFEIAKSDYVPDENAENMTGAGGTQVVTLKVTKAGSSGFVGTYSRPWVTPSADKEADFSMTVVSTE
jgi:predicted secreted protein